MRRDRVEKQHIVPSLHQQDRKVFHAEVAQCVSMVFYINLDETAFRMPLRQSSEGRVIVTAHVTPPYIQVRG